MAHYSVVVAVESGRLLARATRDFQQPVPAAALAVAAGDEVVWFCESGELWINFDESPFEAGLGRLVASPKEPGVTGKVAPAGGPRQVFEYRVRVETGDGAVARGAAHLIVEDRRGVVPENHANQKTSITREGEFLDRAPGGIRMNVHRLIIKQSTTNAKQIEYDYWFNTTLVSTFNLIKYIVVRNGDEFRFETPQGKAVVSFGKDGTPIDGDESVIPIPDPAAVIKMINGKDESKFSGYKFSVVLFVGSDVAQDDPHIIIDNT